MNKYVLEVCCGSVSDCVRAEAGGADRIELNSALYMGGLTPSAAAVRLAKQKVHIPIIAMVRPRGAGFAYHDTEQEVMLAEAKELLEAGADGIAFGFLHKDCTIHKEATKAMTSLIHSYHKEAVFHRAFDCVNDPFQSIEALISLKIDRVLTSGLQHKAIEGLDLIKELQYRYGKQIEILAGSGVQAENALHILRVSGVSQIHSSCKSWNFDPTTSSNGVTYGYADVPHELDYDSVSASKAIDIKAAIAVPETIHYQHVLFDIDGTLLDNTYSVITSLQDTLRLILKREYSEAELSFCLGITGKQALHQLGCPDVDEAQRIWDEELQKYLHTVTVFTGITETVKKLHNLGIRLGIVSSKTRSEFEHEMRNYEMMPYFDTVILADDTLKHKPNPDPILAYLEKTGADPFNTVYVGDSIYDMQCADAAKVGKLLALWGSQLNTCELADGCLQKPADLFAHL